MDSDESKMDDESKFLKQAFILRKNILQAGMQFIEQLREIVEPFRILRDEGKEFFSIMGLEEEKAEKAFEKYKSRLLKRFGVPEK